ncbi:MAG: hypothetical protein KKA07_13520 [Bacteroidetes bacterium]|nr:hypothetical protein [Bacteroidota bacterium]MBU1720079.1 hypothetical protein [Bacteroidota bacterium]
MKKAGLFSGLMLICTMAFAQFKVPDMNSIKSFSKTKTMVVLTGDSMPNFDKAIKKYTEKFWKATPFDFIKQSELEPLIHNAKYSFLLLSEAPFKVGDKTVSMLNLSLGLANRNRTDDDLIEFVSIPIAYQSNDEAVSDQFDWTKLAAFLQFFQHYLDLLLEFPDVSEMDVYEHYNSNIEDLPAMELWVRPEDCSPDINSFDKFKRVYSNDMKMVTTEELSEIIEKQYLNVAFVHVVSPHVKKKNGNPCLLYIFSTDGNLMYMAEHTIDDKNPAGLLIKDLKEIPRKE